MLFLALLLAISGWLFAIGALSAVGQTIWWMVIFFFASTAASSAYLTVSETFPIEVRALAIAFFYAIGTSDWRRWRSLAAQRADRYRLPQECIWRLLTWRITDDCGGSNRRALLRSGRT